MQSRATLMTGVAFVLALILSGVIAGGAATMIEKRSRSAVRIALETGEHGWAEVHADGLQVILQGTAPSEAERFRAVSMAGSIVDSARVVDNTDVEKAETIAPPAFSLQMLRNENGISLIGLVPASVDREAVLKQLQDFAGDEPVTDMLETADYPVPPGWDEALRYGLATIGALPRAKVSLVPGQVSVQAIADSVSEKGRIETSLARRRPSDLKLDFDISAPRPVITPFTLRFLIDADGARFDACSADTERARDRILGAARKAGAEGTLVCTIGMGVPSPHWAEAVDMTLGALHELGAGTVTFSDADVALIAAPSVAQADFDRVVGELESNLPDVFSLKASLEKPPEAQAGVPEFVAQMTPGGQVTLRGRVADERQREAVENFARARFGHGAVYGATRVDETLPAGWPVRVLAALEALDTLGEGRVNVTPDRISVSGISGDPAASDTIARVLTGRLGEGAQMALSVRYDKRLDPTLALPTGRECVTRLNGVLTSQKINFDPGSATISADGSAALEALAGAMKDCTDFRMEVGGHTDSQGREEMNLQLSQDRAQAVIRALLDRRVPVGNLSAKGYGETQPIGDNETEEGRETNRRIEFVLLDEAPVGDGTLPPATATSAAQPDAAASEAAPEETGPETAGIAETAETDAPGDTIALEEPAPDAPPMEDAGDEDETLAETPPAGTASGATDSAANSAADAAAAGPAETPADPVAIAQDPAIAIDVQDATEQTQHPRARPDGLGN